MKIKNKVKEALKVGYVRIYRNLTHWEWYQDIPCKVLYIHCIIEANFNSKKWQNNFIKKGSFITSLSKLSIDTGLTIQQVRTALNKLKSTQDLTYISTSKYTVINVCNYCDWQKPEEENNTVNNIINNKRTTNEQQTNNNQITTTNKANNNIEREYRETFEILIKYAELKGAKSPTAYASKILHETKEENLKNVVESLQKEIEKIEKNNQKKLQKEEEKRKQELENQTIKPVSEYSDNEILEVLNNFEEEKSKNPKILIKSPVVKNAEKEAKKRGLI